MGLLPLTLDWLHVEQAILHGELLSVHKIRQAYPGAPEITENTARTQRTRVNRSYLTLIAIIVISMLLAGLSAFHQLPWSDEGVFTRGIQSRQAWISRYHRI